MSTKSLIEPDLTHSVIGAFYDVYNTLGYGFLEHIYVRAMERELRSRGHDVGREVGVRITYKGEELGIQRLDMIVDGVLVVEIARGPSPGLQLSQGELSSDWTVAPLWAGAPVLRTGPPRTASGATVQATRGIREFRNAGIAALWVIPGFLHPRIPGASLNCGANCGARLRHYPTVGRSTRRIFSVTGLHQSIFRLEKTAIV